MADDLIAELRREGEVRRAGKEPVLAGLLLGAAGALAECRADRDGLRAACEDVRRTLVYGIPIPSSLDRCARTLAAALAPAPAKGEADAE